MLLDVINRGLSDKSQARINGEQMDGKEELPDFVNNLKCKHYKDECEYHDNAVDCVL